MKRLALALVFVLAFAGSAFAQCYQGEDYWSCNQRLTEKYRMQREMDELRFRQEQLERQQQRDRFYYQFGNPTGDRLYDFKRGF